MDGRTKLRNENGGDEICVGGFGSYLFRRLSDKSDVRVDAMRMVKTVVEIPTFSIVCVCRNSMKYSFSLSLSSPWFQLHALLLLPLSLLPLELFI